MKKLTLPLFLVFIFILFSTIFTICQPGKTATKRGFLLLFKYPTVVIRGEQKAELDLMVVNTGEKEEQIFLSIFPEQKAKNWEFGIETRWDKLQIQGVSLLTKDPDDSVTLKFYAKPPEDAKEGKYIFTVKGVTKDKEIQQVTTLTIYLKKEKEVLEEGVEDIELTADYPTIENPAGREFKFTMSVKNNTEKSMVLDLGAEYPYGWVAYCTPRWEEDRKISSIKVDSKSSENLLLTLIPPPNVSKGEYPVKFVVKSENKTKTLDLKAKVTGTYTLKVRPETGRLNLDIIAGEKENLNLFVWNEGSAPVEDISFFATDTPKNWEISFDPEKISSLSPYQQVKKPEKVRLTIVSPPRTLPGDYMFTVKAIGKQDQDAIDLRVTVKRSTLWGWVGIGIVIVIIVALVGIFVKLGRR